MDRHLAPYSPLDAERRQVTDFWAAIIVLANTRSAEGSLLSQQRNYVLDRATWAVTEITPAATTKYFRQRYWSFDALKWSLDRSATKSKAGGALRHEHVVERRGLIHDLARCVSVSAATATLDRATACVVTIAEAERLDRVALQGWSRYRATSIQVFDRQLRAVHQLP